MPIVLIQNWEEKERGWGSRPDGFTIHLSREQHAAYVKDYYAKHNNLPSAPDEYTCVDGEPIFVDVPIMLFNQIAERCLRKVGGQIVNGTHGKGRFFTATRALTFEDLP